MLVFSLDQNLVPLGWREMLKLQRFLSNKRHCQVEVVIPQLKEIARKDLKAYDKELCDNKHLLSILHQIKI